MYGYGYNPYMMAMDPTYLLVIVGVILCMLAQARVKSTFATYSKVRSMGQMTGAQVARQILNYKGLYDVQVLHVSGSLTDHYDPVKRTVSLSDSVYSSMSVAAISVAAHECGHAIQHAKAYAPLKIRSALVPVANIGASVSWPLILIGIVMGGSSVLVNIGVWMFTIVVLFHLVTLPVEFDASKRGLGLLYDAGILYGEENRYAKAVLGAAALTYVASAASMALQLLRLLLITQRYRGRRD